MQEVREHLLHFSHREQVRNDLVHKRSVCLMQIIEQILRLLPAEDLSSVLLDDLGEVGCKDRDRINDGIAVQLRLLTLILRDPECRQPECRLSRLNARHLFEHRPRVHREIVIEHQLTARDLNTLQFNDICIRLDLYIITDADGRHNKAELERTLPSDHDDAVEEVTSLPRIHERDEAVADLKFHRIDLQERDDILRGRRLLFRLCLPLDLLHLLLHRLPAMEIPRDEAAERGKRQEGDARKTRHDSKEEEYARQDHENTRIAEELFYKIASEVPLRSGTGYDNTGRC